MPRASRPEKPALVKIFQNAHDARASLEEKQAKYEDLVQAAKDAPLAVDKARAELALDASSRRPL